MAKSSRKKTTKKSASAKASSSRARSKPASKKKTAKKADTKKTSTKKKATAKKASSKKPAAKKATSKKTTTKKASTKKPAAKKSPAKAGSKKPAVTKSVKKTTSKKKTSATKAAGKKPAAKKPASKKPASKKPASKKPAAKKTPAKKADDKKSPPAKAGASKDTKTNAGGNDAKKSGRKGITIVSDRKKKKSRAKAPRKPFITPGGSLLGPGVVRKPLIPSGPSAETEKKSVAADSSKPKKSPFNKRELTKFKNLLLIKRAELFGDIEQMEADALRSNSGNLSHLPQHLADQGSDNYEQSLSLDLAAADRRLIKEIDDALARVDARTYGVCERTGKPIRKTRLQELPWARYSIEAAREMERRGGF